MILEGKTVNFLGDSITAGQGVEDMENRYDRVISRECGLKQANNHGIGGTRIAYRSKPTDRPWFDLYFCGRAHRMEPDADVVVVFGGTNDYGSGDAPIGTMTDDSPETFCGAVDYLMRTLKELYPKAAIVFMTPARRLGDEAPAVYLGVTYHTHLLREFVEVIRKKGEQYQIPVLNLYEELGIDPNLEEDRETYTTDGLHFNDAGHRVIADRLTAFLKAL